MKRTIELRQSEVGPNGSGIAHYYWVYKEDGFVKEEIHGWPYHKDTGKPVEIEDFSKYFGGSDLFFLWIKKPFKDVNGFVGNGLSGRVNRRIRLLSEEQGRFHWPKRSTENYEKE
jgi:hypothetical protein